MYKTKKYIATIIFALFLSSCSSYYVQVIDQYGAPVPDITFRVSSLSNAFLVSGYSNKYHTTTAKGRFSIGGPRVGIDLIEYNGYEFSHAHGFGSISITPKILKEYYANKPNSYKNPYYILAWKREAPEQLIPAIGGFRLKPDNKFHQIKLKKIRGSTKELYLKSLPADIRLENGEAPLLVRYKEFDEVWFDNQGKERHPWELTLRAPQGGLIATQDLIRNLAPKDGYQEEITIRSSDFRQGIYHIKRRFYFKSQNGQVYGQFEIDFTLHRREMGFDSFWLNPNGSRNLTRPKNFAYCLSRYNVYDCSLDNYGP